MKNSLITLCFLSLCLYSAYLYYQGTDFYKESLLVNASWQKRIDLIVPKNELDVQSGKQLQTEHIRLIGRIRFLANGIFIRTYSIITLDTNEEQNVRELPPLTDRGSWSIMDSYLIIKSEGFDRQEVLSEVQTTHLDRVKAILGKNSEQVLHLHQIDSSTVLLVGLDTISKVLVAN
jgi:hypothetical protein